MSIFSDAGLAQAETRARLASDALEKVTACIEVYLEHLERRRCAPVAFLATIDRILESKYGRALWPLDRSRLHMRAYRAAKNMRQKPRPGAAAHPREILDIAVQRLAQEAHDAGHPYSDGEGARIAAYTIASERLREDFGLTISPSSIRAHHQKMKKRR